MFLIFLHLLYDIALSRSRSEDKLKFKGTCILVTLIWLGFCFLMQTICETTVDDVLNLLMSEVVMFVLGDFLPNLRCRNEVMVCARMKSTK